MSPVMSRLKPQQYVAMSIRWKVHVAFVQHQDAWAQNYLTTVVIIYSRKNLYVAKEVGNEVCVSS